MNYLNLITVISRENIFGDTKITFKNAKGQMFYIVFSQFTDNDSLISYINAADLLKENIYFDKNNNIFQIKNWVWKYYEQGASWYMVK